MKQLLLRSIMSCVAIIVTFICIELFLRLLNITPPIFQVSSDQVRLSENPILGYELIPGHSDISVDGFRSPMIAQEKNPNIIRLAMLGDSVAYGCCLISISETMALRLSELLNESTKSASKYEIINAGVVGYNPLQEAELFRVKLKKYKPDIIFWQITIANDYLPKTFDYDYLLLHQKDKRLRSSTLKFYEYAALSNRYLYSLYSYRYLLYVLTIIQSQNNDVQNENQMLLNTTTTPNNNYWDIVDSIINKKKAEHPWSTSSIIPSGFNLLKQSLDYQVQVFVVIVPDLQQDLLNYDQLIYKHHDDLAHWAKYNNFNTIDLLPCYQQSLHSNPSLSLTEDGLHPSTIGHEIAAHCIFKYFIQTNEQHIDKNMLN